jgi:hypothetical protein
MASLRTAEDVAAAAERKLAARAVAVRSSWRTLKTGCRNALTGPVAIGTVTVAGAMLGARRAAASKPVECKCVKAAPSWLRAAALAIFSQLLQEVAAKGLRRFAETSGAQTTEPLGPSSPET